MPYFTIVIPTFNRGHLLERALRTCIAQDFADWEAVVVDDASSDATAVASADVVRRIDDPRVRLIRHDQNLGVCAARNTAVRAARGTWLIFHDDDDELVPGGLQLIHEAAERAGSGIHRHVFAYRDDERRISPDPALADGAVWEYRQYVEWLERVSARTDFLNCIRRDVFDSILWPADRSREEIFHLELARRFRTQCHSEIAAIIHTDAVDRFTAVAGYDRLLRMAPDLATQWIRLLNEHGEALKQWAPRKFAGLLRSTAINSYMAGSRARGLRYSAALLRTRPFAPSAWAVLMFGLLSRRTVGRVVALEKRRRNHASPLLPAVK
jgi:glycosyltransferase involved in cell wall biosynthesis